MNAIFTDSLEAPPSSPLLLLLRLWLKGALMQCHCIPENIFNSKVFVYDLDLTHTLHIILVASIISNTLRFYKNAHSLLIAVCNIFLELGGKSVCVCVMCDFYINFFLNFVFSVYKTTHYIKSISSTLVFNLCVFSVTLSVIWVE